jgi:hypothetical protein
VPRSLSSPPSSSTLTATFQTLTKQNKTKQNKTKQLIAYGDQLHDGETPTLQVLNDFLLKRGLERDINTVHLLPFFPYSSDDGFSVIDYRQVAKEMGDWTDVSDLADHFGLMFDLVVNHCSQVCIYHRTYTHPILLIILIAICPHLSFRQPLLLAATRVVPILPHSFFIINHFNYNLFTSLRFVNQFNARSNTRGSKRSSSAKSRTTSISSPPTRRRMFQK